MGSKIKDRSTDLLFQAILSPKTVEGYCGFFGGLCTIPEIEAMSQRLIVAYILHNKCVYSDIAAKIGTSTTTISRVSRSLNCGCGGREIIFKRLEGNGDTEQ